ncbi:MAG: acyl-CoA dehydrogenase family protein [Candidatus Binatia bacterium]
MTDTAALDMIRHSAEGIADRRDLRRVRTLRYTLPGFDRALWNRVCDLGWPALRVPERRGGVGLGLSAYCALAQELGAALMPEPVIGAILSSSLLDDAALADHLAGTALVLPMWQDSRDATGPAIGLRVEGGELYGCKYYVPMAAGADAFLAIGPTEAWLVDASSAGVKVDILETQDGGHFGTVTFHRAHGRRIPAAAAAPALAEACLATSAYLLGIIDAALERTLEYLRTRVQFGKVIGSFQALQHRAVELKLQAELTRASVGEAAARWDREPATAAAYAAISRAKARASTAAMLVTQQAIQLHGGIAFTDDHDIGLFLRKAMVVAPQYGSAALHRARYAQLIPADSAP